LKILLAQYKVIELWGIKLHAYGLLIGIGVYLAWEITRKFGRVKDEVLEKMFFGLIFFGILGARMYHVVDLWEYYSNNLVEILYVWNGGLGIWGALIGGIGYLGIFTYFKKLNFLEVLDSIVIGLPLAQTIGRLGNWVNGELYGKNGEPLFAWEGALSLVLFGVLLYFSGFRVPETYPGSKDRPGMTTKIEGAKHRNEGFIAGVYLIGYGVIRIALENFRDNNIIWRIGGVPTAIIFGIIAIFFGLILVIPGLTRNLYK